MSTLSKELHDQERGDGPLQVRLRETATFRVPLLRQVEQEKVQHPGSHKAQAPVQAGHLQHVVLRQPRSVIFATRRLRYFSTP